ncbi:hypothetical protein VCHA49P380_30138 [Vibrio chagasii]|nr:hypothetical protein VCHA49P380_30138 [Vibrio chagasii]
MDWGRVDNSERLLWRTTSDLNHENCKKVFNRIETDVIVLQ